MKRRNGAATLLKGTVSVVLLTYVFGKVGWSSVWSEIRHADPLPLALYVFLGLVSVVVSTWKWWVLCRATGIETSPTRLFWLYLVGMFFNQFLPTSVGGDVVRGLEAGRLHGDGSRAMASVFMERFTGLTALMVLALVAVLVDSRWIADLRVAALLASVGVMYAVGVWMVFSPRFLHFVVRRFRFAVVRRGAERVGRLQNAIRAYRSEPGALFWAMILSVIFYALTVLITYTGCLVFGVRLPLISVAAAVPILLILFLVPVSIGGIGLQEWAYTFVLGALGVPPAVGLSVGLIYRARSVAFGLVGGAIYPFVSHPSVHSRPASLGVSEG